MRILVFLLFSFAASAQIPLYQLEYAPDSMKVIGAAADGEPIWVNRSSSAKVKNSHTMTLRIQNDSIRADIKKRLDKDTIGGQGVFLALRVDSTGQIFGFNEIISDDFDKDEFNEIQTLSIDSLNRVFRITLSDGGVVKFLDRGITTNDSIYFSRDTIFLRDGSGFAALPCDKFIEIDRTKTGNDFDYPSDQVACGTVGYTFYTNISSYDCIAWHYTLDGVSWSLLFEDCDLYSDNEGDLFLTSGGANDVHLRSNTNFLKYILIQGLSGIKITEDASSGIINFGVDSVWISNIISDSLANIPRDTITLTESGIVNITGTFPDFTIGATPDEIIRTGNTITLRDGDGSVDLSDLVNVADSTVVVDGWGITSVESPTNTYNLMADSSQVATQYDLSLKENKLPSFTNGSVIFSDGTTLAQDNTNLFWDDSDNKLGIRTNDPNHYLDLRGDLGVYNSGIDGSLEDVIFFGSQSFPTSFRNKIKSSISALPQFSKLVFSLSSGSSTFSDALTITGTKINVNSLAGSGTRMVTANTDGDLSTSDIPTGTVTSITATAPLTGGTITTSGTIGADTTSATGLSTQYDLTLKQDILTGANKRIPYFTGTNTISSSDNLSYDNKQLGIGTISPQATLDLSSSGGNSIRFYDSAAGTNYKEWKINFGNNGREMNFVSRSDLGSEYNFMTFNRATNSQIMANWYAPFISSDTGTGDNVMTINEVGSIYRYPLKTVNTTSLLGSGDITTESPLTFSSPLSRSGNTISLPAASTSVSGHLTSNDWNLFNNWMRPSSNSWNTEVYNNQMKPIFSNTDSPNGLFGYGFWTGHTSNSLFGAQLAITGSASFSPALYFRTRDNGNFQSWRRAVTITGNTQYYFPKVDANGDLELGTTFENNLFLQTGRDFVVDKSLPNIRLLRSGSNHMIMGDEFGIWGINPGSFSMFVYGNNSFNISTNSGKRLNISGSGTVTLSSLSGSGTRMVTANSSGDLATQAIPTIPSTWADFTTNIQVWNSTGTFGSGKDVGIGDQPTRDFDVNGTTRLRGAIYDSGNSAGSSGQVLTSQGTGAWTWTTPTSGATDLTFTGTSSPYTLNSSTGTDVTFSSGSSMSIVRSGNDLYLETKEPTVNTYTTVGTGSVWSKPTGARMVYVKIIGGGGGGAGGSKGTSTGFISGGGGGCAGGISEFWFRAIDLPANVTITVGSGGTAGSGAASVGLGGNGGTGGNSIFGIVGNVYLQANGGAGGIANGSPSNLGFGVLEDGGVGGFWNGSGVFTAAPNTRIASGGGGAGASINNNVVSNGNGAQIQGQKMLQNPIVGTSTMTSIGSGGGNASISTNGTSGGGNAAFLGAGGGGGGASTVGNGGNGGVGGRGEVQVITYY